MMGFGMVRIPTTISTPARSRGSSSRLRPLARASWMSFRSPPEQNALPVPVSTTTRICGSSATRAIARASSVLNSTLSALSRSGRFIVSVATGPSRVSSTRLVRVAGCSAWGTNLLIQALQHLTELAKAAELLPAADGVLPAGRGQHEDQCAVEPLLLQAKLARTLGKFLEHQLAVEGNDAWRILFKLVCQQDAAFGNLMPVNLFDPSRGALDEIGQPD